MHPIWTMMFLTFVILHHPSQVRSTEGCYAPPSAWGGVCNARESVFGSRNLCIQYSVDVIGDTVVLCQARCFSWGNQFCDVGKVNGGSWSMQLEWGENIAKPAIKCKGIPSGSGVEWNYKVSTCRGSDL